MLYASSIRKYAGRFDLVANRRLYSSIDVQYTTSPIKVQAFCMAESFQIPEISEAIASKSPSLFCAKLISQDILLINEACRKTPFSGIFIFSAGCMVTWQLESMRPDFLQSLLQIFTPFQRKKMFFSPQNTQKIDSQLQRSMVRSSFLPCSDILSKLNCSPMEADGINVVFSLSAFPASANEQEASSIEGNTNNDIITLSSSIRSEKSIKDLATSSDHDFLLLERVSISYALARSVRLGFLEHLLNDYLTECKHRDLAMKLAFSGTFGKMKRTDALKALGQMIYCRGQLNLYHSRLQLTDSSPDLFWDSSSLLTIYNKISSYLEAPSRISQLNKKMDYAGEITGLLRTTLVENHSHFLEVMIIALICIEVGFECLHYFLLFKHPEVLGIDQK
ncbi:hypothetical protein MDAP_000215 [Mitosporidium daphniae]|uniref:YagE family protein n=1 Tax=Mitosporidium daphniae TaxID=1485682 RepID=A0A098VZJ5_9MICR|nr:YagE family protein [Mitosporidium daphniae]KGG53181.1 YagE family protein [Mitosporidium daphniae]|eukprot:XP_013239617.1 YagE family protein [Mitosporidium daphniae]